METVEESLTPPIEDTFQSSTATIHRSPFTREAQKRYPLIESILKEKKDKTAKKTKILNPNYCLDIILSLYRWFAYLPFSTCIMSDYYER